VHHGCSFSHHLPIDTANTITTLKATNLVQVEKAKSAAVVAWVQMYTALVPASAALTPPSFPTFSSPEAATSLDSNVLTLLTEDWSTDTTALYVGVPLVFESVLLCSMGVCC
jgi:hypothetical protein